MVNCTYYASLYMGSESGYTGTGPCVHRLVSRQHDNGRCNVSGDSRVACNGLPAQRAGPRVLEKGVERLQADEVACSQGE